MWCLDSEGCCRTLSLRQPGALFPPRPCSFLCNLSQSAHQHYPWIFYASWVGMFASFLLSNTEQTIDKQVQVVRLKQVVCLTVSEDWNRVNLTNPEYSGGLMSVS